MPKLLVAFDGSETALRGLRYAITLAKSMHEASIHLVHAHEAPDVDGAVSIYVTHDKMAELQQQHSQGLLEAGTRLLTEAGIAHTAEVLTGHLGQVIARRADELGCDMIVMGTRGMGAVGNLFMGSVSTKVVHFAHVPVTLVK
jgi:nucleotide-binding universal stress UspA family protein